MIVKHKEAGWEIIYHYAHGLLAGQIAHHLHPDLRPVRWIETLTAIIEHDDQQLDFSEKVYVGESGAPRDFTQEERSADYRLEHARRVVESALRKSGWVALLISLHLDFLYGDLSADHPDFNKFLQTQQELRKQLRKRYGLSKKASEAIYALLRFCDRCSLILCQDEVPSLGRRVEVNKSIGQKRYFLRRTEQGKINIHPWCFADDEFTVSIESRLLTQLSYDSDEALHEALEAAPVQIKEWTFCNVSDE